MLLALCGALVLVQATGADDAGPVTVPFSAHVTFPADHCLTSAVFAPDGSSLYAHVVVPAIDLWPIVVSFWPEALIATFSVFTVFCLWRWRVVAVRRRERGKRYCRGCNYDVTGLARDEGAAASTATKCPECGRELSISAIVEGRSTFRRLRWLCALWVMGVIGSAGLYLFKVPRHGQLSNWFSWCSKDLADWATRRQNAWLLPTITDCDRVVELDPATGQMRRVVTTVPSRTYFNLGISPDGQFLFLGSRDANRITCINVAGGGVHRAARLPGSPTLMVHNPAVIGFSPDGSTAYVQWHDDPHNTSGVSAWELATNKVSTALSVPAYLDTRNPRPASWPRHFLVRFDQGGKPVFLSFPDFMESFPSKQYIVRIYEGDHGAREFQLNPSPDHECDPAWRVSEQQLIAVTEYGERLSGWSVADGSPLGSVAIGLDRGGGSAIAHDRDERFLATGFGGMLSVRDAAAGRWLAKLQCPSSGYGARIRMSPDGEWCAAVFQTRKPSSRPQVPVFELATWHLDARALARRQEQAAEGK